MEWCWRSAAGSAARTDFRHSFQARLGSMQLSKGSGTATMSGTSAISLAIFALALLWSGAAVVLSLLAAAWRFLNIRQSPAEKSPLDFLYALGRKIRKAEKESELTAIEELDYRPNAIARSLSRGCAMTLGVIVPFFVRPSALERLRGAAVPP